MRRRCHFSLIEDATLWKFYISLREVELIRLGFLQVTAVLPQRKNKKLPRNWGSICLGPQRNRERRNRKVSSIGTCSDMDLMLCSYCLLKNCPLSLSCLFVSVRLIFRLSIVWLFPSFFSADKITKADFQEKSLEFKTWIAECVRVVVHIWCIQLLQIHSLQISMFSQLSLLKSRIWCIGYYFRGFSRDDTFQFLCTF